MKINQPHDLMFKSKYRIIDNKFCQQNRFKPVLDNQRTISEIKTIFYCDI